MARIRKPQSFSLKIWKIALYIRLSKEDGNDESLSVANQRKILTDYLSSNWKSTDFELFDTYIDDGLTGTDTNRENFIRMRQDIVDGKVDCIVVKSLARAFRNLADQQKFLEEFLPLHRARFISLGSPFIDTFENPNAVSGFEVPIRGMFNEQFAAATSEEIRKTFHMKRSRGEFIGAFAPFGYKKDPNNKNKLLIDEDAEPIVKDIFHWFLYGIDGEYEKGTLSINGIVKELNERSIPCPTEYKQEKGLKYQNPSYKFEKHIWISRTVSGILKNQMYTGNMVQGKQKVISYKIHKQITIPENEWYIVKNTHQPIISQDEFDEVQARMKNDTRTAPNSKNVHLFAGLLKCGECGRALHRKGGRNGQKYFYCRISRQKDEICKTRSIREDILYEIILHSINAQISLINNFDEISDKVALTQSVENKNERLVSSIEKHKKEINRINKIKDSLYEDWKSGIISLDDFERMRKDYSNRVGLLNETMEKINAQKALQEHKVNCYPDIIFFNLHKKIELLTRDILTELVQNIILFKDGTVEIIFRFSDQFIGI